MVKDNIDYLLDCYFKVFGMVLLCLKLLHSS